MKKLVRVKKKDLFYFTLNCLYQKVSLQSLLEQGVIRRGNRNVLRVYTYTDVCPVKSKFEDTRYQN